jgi:hypothetical protein
VAWNQGLYEQNTQEKLAGKSQIHLLENSDGWLAKAELLWPAFDRSAVKIDSQPMAEGYGTEDIVNQSPLLYLSGFVRGKGATKGSL